MLNEVLVEVKGQWTNSWKEGPSMATALDDYLLSAVPEAICLFISVVGKMGGGGCCHSLAVCGLPDSTD